MHSAGWPASPHHQRAPSLGELHQELENEQEAQVVSHSTESASHAQHTADIVSQNRLLAMIRQQQVHTHGSRHRKRWN